MLTLMCFPEMCFYPEFTIPYSVPNVNEETGEVEEQQEVISGVKSINEILNNISVCFRIKVISEYDSKWIFTWSKLLLFQ